MARDVDVFAMPARLEVATDRPPDKPPDKPTTRHPTTAANCPAAPTTSGSPACGAGQDRVSVTLSSRAGSRGSRTPALRRQVADRRADRPGNPWVDRVRGSRLGRREHRDQPEREHTEHAEHPGHTDHTDHAR